MCDTQRSATMYDLHILNTPGKAGFCFVDPALIGGLVR
jgi:hypothetical protein